MNRSKVLTDGALLTAIYIVLLLIAVFTPIIGAIATFLLPVPFIIFAYRYNWKPTLMVFVAAILFSSLFEAIFSIPTTVLMGLGGLMLGSAMHNKLTPYETLLRGSLGFVVGLLFIFFISQLVFNVSLVDSIGSMMEESMQTSQKLLEQFGLDSGEDQLAAMEQLVNSFESLIPVGVALIAILLAFISQWIGYKVINRLEKKKFSFPPFKDLRLPVSLVWIYFFSLMLMLFDLDQSGIFYHALNNVLVLTGLLMTIQGFSFIFFYAFHKKKSKAIPIVIVIVSLLLPFLLLYLIRVIGIIDIGFRLRDRISKGKK